MTEPRRMSNRRYQQIKELCDRFDDLPDGAFLSVLAEHGVGSTDLYHYSQEHERRHPRKPSKKSRHG